MDNNQNGPRSSALRSDVLRIASAGFNTGLKMRLKTLRAIVCMLALMTVMPSCIKDDIIPEKEQEGEITDTPEEILMAVSGVYSVEKVTESQKEYLFEFGSPTPITLKKNYPEGISKVTLKKSDVRKYSEDGKNISVTFLDGKTASLQYSAWLSVKFAADAVSFDEACSPEGLAFEILENDSDSLSVRAEGCGRYANYETEMGEDLRSGRIVFHLISDKYFSADVTVSVSNGKRTVSQKVSLSRVDFKFADGDLSKVYSFPEYERYFELEMHCADKSVQVSIPEYCKDWIQAKANNINLNGTDRTMICILLAENPEDTLRTGEVILTRGGVDREIPIVFSQIGAGMEGSLRYGLESFYRALHGDAWIRNDNWCSDRPVLEWYGVTAGNMTCKTLFGDEGNAYLGTDDEWILDLAANNMRGTVPDSFWKVCRYFSSIRISSEYLPDSTVPDCVWHENLWKLDLSTSFMNVPLSPAIAGATKLQYLDLQLCNVGGSLPEEFTSLPVIREVNMRECSITGTLPQNLGNMKSLRTLLIDHNMELGGTLPDSFYGMENLVDFDISATKIGGTLSSDITRLGKLEMFNIDGCEFGGTIPEEFGTMDNLCMYDFNGNYFEAIPQFIRYFGYNSKPYKQWVGSAGFPLGVPYFQRNRSDGRPENYIVTVPEASELSEILVDGKPLKRPGYYVDYTRCHELVFPIWAHIRYDLKTWGRSCSLTMKSPQYPYGDDLQYPADEYYYDGRDWKHPKLDYPAREYVKVGDEWVHDPSCPWDAEYIWQ